MTIHVYHPYRQPDGTNHCQAVNGHCSHLCLPAPQINSRSPKISCACPTGLKLMDDGLMCVEDGKCERNLFYNPNKTGPPFDDWQSTMFICDNGAERVRKSERNNPKCRSINPRLLKFI